MRCDNLPSFIVEKSWKIAERLSTEVGKILLWIKHGLSLSLENVCDSSRLHQTGLFCSAAVVPQSESTELCSSAAVVSQSKSTELCSSAAVVPQSKSTELCSSAAVVPQSKSTELCSSAAVVPQSKSTELCSSVAVVAQSKSTELCSLAAVVPQSKSSEIWRSSAPFHHDLWYLRHWNQQTEFILSKRSAQKSNLRSLIPQAEKTCK